MRRPVTFKVVGGQTWETCVGGRPKSLEEFELVWSALWNTLGHVINNVSDEQSGEVTSPALTT